MKRVVITIWILITLTAILPLFSGAEERSERTKQFIVMGYQGIQLDVTSGKGPYLRTLFDLMGVPAGSEGKITDQLKALLKSHPNIMDFADQVLLLETKNRDAAVAAAEIPVPSGKGIYSGGQLIGALEHLTRGMNVTVTLKTGEQLKGTFADYASKRLWIRGAARKSVHVDDILALEAPQL